MASDNDAVVVPINSACQVPEQFLQTLAPGEQVQAAFGEMRQAPAGFGQALLQTMTTSSAAVFTNKRLIFVDASGKRGKNATTFSLPWKAVNFWDTKTSQAMLSSGAEISLFTQPFTITLKTRNLDYVPTIDKIIAAGVFGQ